MGAIKNLPVQLHVYTHFKGGPHGIRQASLGRELQNDGASTETAVPTVPTNHVSTDGGPPRGPPLSDLNGQAGRPGRGQPFTLKP